MVDLDIPYYANTSDDTHCFQAALKMMLKYFLPEKDFSFERLDKITAKQKDKGAWISAGCIWLARHGFDVINMEVFDYKRFIKEKEKHLEEFYGKEAAKVQINNSYIAQEVRVAEDFIKEIKTYKIIPQVKDIEGFMRKGSVVICLVNSRSLNNKAGYMGHFVVIKGIRKDCLLIHDPGLPGEKSRKVDFDSFKRAWQYPDKNAANLMAFKPVSSDQF